MKVQTLPFPLLVAVLFWGMVWARAGELMLSLEGGVPWLQSGACAGQRIVLERGEGLEAWQEAARVTGQLWPYADGASGGRSAGFYRLRLRPVTAEDDWSNQMVVTEAGLWQGVSGGVASVKWLLELAEPGKVYFQDSVKYPYHLQFARARMRGYGGMGPVEFGLQSLYPGVGQRMVVGSVFRAPDVAVREVGIEISGAVAFPVESAAGWFGLVQRRLGLPDGWRVYYMPSPEQQEATEAAGAWLAAQGVEVSGLDRWVDENICYSEGWALGKVVVLPAAEIAAALGDGRLGLADILVTDRAPSELPVLAGYVSLSPATPNSHVVLLARSGLLPFAYADGEGLRAELEALAGREVLLVVERDGEGCRIDVRDVTGLLSDARRQEILAMKQGGPLQVTPRQNGGKLVVPADGLTPADLPFCGGKAANFGFLRRALPENSPHPALAITFDLWDALMKRPGPGGGSLGSYIGGLLSRHVYPPVMAALRSDLELIRAAVAASEFTPAERAEVMAMLWNAGLSGAKIRFRSSTNLEDTAGFSGAGLYDSFSGCLEDDTDGDAGGPSHCDPGESSERGVFRAIRKVYAGFYNENAVLERLRLSVNESAVGMAMLVHFSVPDSEELANGVATVEIERGVERKVTVRMVSQVGADPVSNPESGARAEVVVGQFRGDTVAGATFVLSEASSLRPPGETVMEWTDDYRVLLGQLNTAALAWESYYPGEAAVELDLEYKKQKPGVIGLKQIRAVPRPVPVPPPQIP